MSKLRWMTEALSACMTPADAQRLQDEARERGQWLMWFVSYERPGKFIARAHTAAHDGGKWLSGELVADTVGELRAMLPIGLERTDRSAVMSPEVVEAWD